jgi:hypothetical protein
MATRRALVVAVATALFAPLLAAPPPVAAADPVLVGAGDIANCSTTADSATARLLDGIAGTVFTLGDNAYPNGSNRDYRRCYRPTWGRHEHRTRPAPGNHEYKTAGADGYFDYFDPNPGARRQGWYSYDLGSWHIVVLNSNCSKIGGCGRDSPQVDWLRGDLAANAGRNVLAYWHHPLFSSGRHGPERAVRTFWDVLYANGADIVLNGHEHDYERFAPQDPAGRADSEFGIRQFIVGTGGTNLRSRATNAANSQVFSSTHGVLKLTLRADAYDWEFVPIAGRTFTDRGTTATHGPPGGLRTTTVTATADAFVDQARPRTNFDASSRLYVDGNTGKGRDRRAYIRFVVTGISGTVRGAYLRFRVGDGTVNGPRVYPTSSGWSAPSLTWRNRPAATGAAVDDLGRTPSRRWNHLDVTRIVRGNGTYSFLLRSTSGDGLSLSSIQGSRAPRLVIQTTP